MENKKRTERFRKKMTLKEITNDGFELNINNSKINDVAFLSLRIALKAYFNTYKSISYSIESNYVIFEEVDEVLEKKLVYPTSYIENYCETITHLHHFFELVIKEIVKEKENFLIYYGSEDADKDKIKNYLKGVNVDTSSINTKDDLTVNFTVLIDRLKSLVNKGLFENSMYNFFSKFSDFLAKLNGLRNKITHQGIYILNYQALDDLCVGYVFPLIKEVLALPKYGNEYIWRYSVVDSNIDLIQLLIDCNTKKEYRYAKIDVLKEIGRAAYENPLCQTKWHYHINKSIIKSVESQAQYHFEQGGVTNIKSCPVCGTKSLVLYNDWVDLVTKDKKEEQVEIIYKIKCSCCSFELRTQPKDFDKMGLPFENFWNI